MSQNIFTKVFLYNLKKYFIKKMFSTFKIITAIFPAQNRQQNFTRQFFTTSGQNEERLSGRSLKQGGGPLSIRDRRLSTDAYKYRTVFLQKSSPLMHQNLLYSEILSKTYSLITLSSSNCLQLITLIFPLSAREEHSL